MNKQKMKNICVVVLGDIGRSPRMQYHSLSLADAGFNVKVIGYEKTKINNSLTLHSNIHIHPLIEYPSLGLPRLFNYILKTIWQCFSLICALVFKNADYVLVQNPPAVPTFFMVWFYCLFSRAKFVIDWHNYAHTIMALTNGKKHVLVNITEWIESYFGGKATANLCVTEAMKKDLEENWNIRAITLYDKPANIFRPITIEEKHEFLSRLSKSYAVFGDNENENKTAFTEINSDGKVVLRNDRPALLVSSTSWTEDEDFSVLLIALQNYEKCCNEETHKLPKLICVITGKGPLKRYYVNKINEQNMQHIKVITPWLETTDYPLLLASADLGVCLHTSSSGLDLPMKIVDMFGCCLPVCAFHYKCLHELIKDKINSYTFKDGDELSLQITDWFNNFPNNKEQQVIEAKFKSEIKKFQNVHWEENWNQNARILFE